MSSKIKHAAIAYRMVCRGKYALLGVLLLALTMARIPTAMAINEIDIALIHASSVGDLQAARALLTKGADVNARISGYGGTALMLAAMNGKLKMAELLLNNGADINASSPEGNTALTFASIYKHGDVVQLLIAHGANDNARRGLTANTKDLNNAKQDFASAEAAFKLGKFEEAAKFYQKAAEQGHVPAQFNMGIMYDIGRGVTQDYQQAIFWYGKAAEHGSVQAQNNLGFMYSEGKGVARDYITAHMWFNIAGARGNEDGRRNRDFVEKLIPPGQLVVAQQLADQWMKTHP